MSALRDDAEPSRQNGSKASSFLRIPNLGNVENSLGGLQNDIGGYLKAWPVSTAKRAFSRIRAYRYEPLEPGQFRVCVLLRGLPEDAIKIEIEHWDIDSENAPVYAALSYVWGDMENMQIIRIGRFEHKITRNLWQFLHRIRPRPEEERDIVVWADQICINQDDQQEKSHQILLMTRIYPLSGKTLCWLGEDDGMVGQAFKLLKEWGAAFNDEKAQLRLAAKMAELLESHAEGTITPLGALFDRPWFRRVWTLQEVCAPFRNPPIFLSGSHEVSWLSLYLGFQAICRHFDTAEVVRLATESVRYAMATFHYGMPEFLEPQEMALSYMIPISYSREATDPKDKIFALLGMSAAKGLRYPQPDYTRPLDELCLIYTRACIETDGTLRILYHASLCKENLHLPSWCVKVNGLKDSDCAHLDGLQKDHSPLFRATLDTKPYVVPATVETDPILVVRGLPLDGVKFVHPVNALEQFLSNEPISWCGILDRCHSFCAAMKLPSVYDPANQSMAEAILRTFSTNGLFSESAMSMQDQNDADRLYNAYKQRALGYEGNKDVALGTRRTLLTHSELLAYVRKHFYFGDSDGDRVGCGTAGLAVQHEPYIPNIWLDRKMALLLLDRIKRKFGGHQIIFTKSGCIGLAAKSCRLGDEVCLLFGGCKPFVLRPLRLRYGEVHQLLGEAYIHGFMFGEGLEAYCVGKQAPKRYCLI